MNFHVLYKLTPRFSHCWTMTCVPRAQLQCSMVKTARFATNHAPTMQRAGPGRSTCAFCKIGTCRAFRQVHGQYLKGSNLEKNIFGRQPICQMAEDADAGPASHPQSVTFSSNGWTLTEGQSWGNLKLWLKSIIKRFNSKETLTRCVQLKSEMH
jgi:hypothetical protein